MRMGMSLSVGQRQELKQAVKLMLKQEISLKLRQVLKQVLKLLMALRQEQTITLAMFQDLRTQLKAEAATSNLNGLAHEVVRRGGMRMAWEVGTLFSFADSGGQDDRPLRDFAEILFNKCRGERRRRKRRRRDETHGIVLAMRMILCQPPPFWGGKDGTPENLEELLRSVPQVNPMGTILWVLAGGWAVELLTAQSRSHHDIDTMLMRPKNPLLADTDQVHSGDYFGVLSCSTMFVKRNCVQAVTWRRDTGDLSARVLCPEFLILSKFLGHTRPQDWIDINALLDHFGNELDLALIAKLLKRKHESATFTRDKELRALLKTRDLQQVKDGLRSLKS